LDHLAAFGFPTNLGFIRLKYEAVQFLLLLQEGLRNGISEQVKVDSLLDQLWLKSMERDELVKKLKVEMMKGEITLFEFEDLLKSVYTSMR
jgi:hypothetical protein